MDGSYSYFVNSVVDLERDNGRAEVPQRRGSAAVLPGDGKGAPGCRPVTRGRGGGRVQQRLKKFTTYASKIYFEVL